MPRMRTIDRAIGELRESDPGCALTKNALRQMIISKRIPAVSVGNGKGPGKYLISMETLEAYLQNPQSTTPAADQTNKIRRIS